jgi:hypothetical protein
MDNTSYTVRVPKRWARLSLVVVVTALIVAPLTAVATHMGFVDVPETNTHHNDIAWLKDADVTKGCNPPTNNMYCPSDFVTRAQMATFMRNLATNQVVDAGTVGGMSADGIAAAGVTTFGGNGSTVVNWFNQHGGQPSVTRNGAGDYTVSFPGLEGRLGCDAMVLITVNATGGFGANTTCAESPNSLRIGTWSAAGNLVDRSFSLFVMQPGS